MSEHQITVEQLIEVARTMSSTETLRRKLEQFAAQLRADAVREAAADLTAIQKAHDEQKTRIYAKLDAAKAQLAEAEKRASAAARFIDFELVRVEHKVTALNWTGKKEHSSERNKPSGAEVGNG